jgi:hypothetical protein
MAAIGDPERVASVEDDLWRSDRRRLAGLRYFAWTVAMAAACWFGFVVVHPGWPVLGVVVIGVAALGMLIVLVMWGLDLRKFVEARTAEDVVLLRNTTGGSHRINVGDIRRIVLHCTYWAHDPDNTLAGSTFLKVELYIHTPKRGHLSRPWFYPWREEVDRIEAAWERLCPGANMERDFHIPSTGTGD